MIWVQFAIVILCIMVGARIGGIGLGLTGGVGLAILAFLFEVKPTSPPIDVMLMILAVVSAAACMQAAGGMDYLVQLAERILRKNPKRITFIAPAVTYFFTMFAGTGHVAYAVLPVIAEVARRTGIRPERPLSIAVIASQVGIVASPIAAATVAMLTILSTRYEITLGQILGITIPATIIGLSIAAAVTNKLGKELKDDPVFQHRMQDPEFRREMDQGIGDRITELKPGAKISVLLFLFGAIIVVFMGAVPILRPQFNGVPMSMAHTIEIVMLSVAALIVWWAKADVTEASASEVFLAGMRAIIAIFGIAWLGDSFFAAHDVLFKGSISDLVHAAPWAFAIALFILSVMVNSQGATVATLMPLGVALGLPVASLIAMFPAVNGYFFVPNYGPILAAIDFDVTGTTRIGKYVFNHSFMLPGLMSVTFSVAAGFAISNFVV